MPRNECRSYLGSNARLLHDTSICTATIDGLGICTGDTGGPLTNDHGYVIGVATNSLRCGQVHPDLFTRVYPYTPFIRHITGIQY